MELRAVPLAAHGLRGKWPLAGGVERAATKRRSLDRLIGSPAFLLLSPLAVLLAWCWASASGRFPETVLAPPWVVVQSGWEAWQSGELWAHLSVSLYRLIGGFLIGGSLGIAFGALIARSRAAERFAAPLFQVLRQMPTVALIPMFILIFGIGETFKIAIVLKASFFVLALATYDAICSLPETYFEVARLYRLPSWTLFRRVLLPASLPAVLTGARLALSRSWMVLVGAELLAAENGIGQMMEISRQIFRMDLVLVGVILTGVIGFLLDRSFLGIEHLVQRGRPAR